MGTMGIVNMEAWTTLVAHLLPRSQQEQQPQARKARWISQNGAGIVYEPFITLCVHYR